MHIVETQVNNNPERNTVKTYVKLGTNYRAGLDLPANANKVIVSETTEMVDVFEVGDRFCCEINRGSKQNEDGIYTGGEWITKTGVVVSASGFNSGFVEFDDFDQQSMSLIRGNIGYPYRNMQPTQTKAEDCNPLYKLKKLCDLDFSSNTSFVEVYKDNKSTLQDPAADTVCIEFSYNGRISSDQNVMKSAFETQPNCVRNCRPFGHSSGVYFCDRFKEWNFVCDGNYGESILIQMSELEEFLKWMDKHFSDLGDDYYGGSWRTAKGAYSKHSYIARTLTIEDIKRSNQLKRFILQNDK